MDAIFPPWTLEKGNKYGGETFVDVIVPSKSGLPYTIFYNHNHNRVSQNFLIHPGSTGKKSWYSYSIAKKRSRAKIPKGRETSPINPVIIKNTSHKNILYFVFYFKKKRSHLTLRYNKWSKKQLWCRRKKSSITIMTYTRCESSFFN